MIRICRTAPPQELSTARAKELTSNFVADQSLSVWDTGPIRAGLMSMTNQKCAYCETLLQEQSKYMEVDHFFPKSKYPERVVDWTNLLPSCKHCNTSKGGHDPFDDPICDPTDTDPRVHLSFYLYRFRGKDTQGRATVEVLDLNDPRQNVLPRFRAGEQILDALEKLAILADNYEAQPNTRNRNKLLGLVRQTLRESGPAAPYGATTATALIGSSQFPLLKRRIEKWGLWNDDLTQLYNASRNIAYV